MAAPTKAELQARVAKLERTLAREKKRKGTAEDLTRARDAQAATAKILRVIRKSPADVQPVFEAIVDSAAALFRRRTTLRLVEDGTLRRVAQSAPVRRQKALPERMAVDGDSLVGQVALAGRAIQVPDMRYRDAPVYARKNAHKWDFRSSAVAPLLCGGRAIGVISLTSPEPGALSGKQMGLLSTFADQAVIAIENARLFKQTKEALERQTATADILKVISGSPDDVQPVFDAVAHSSMRLLGALSASVSIRAGDTLQLGAFTSTSKTGDQAVKGLFPLSLTDNRDTILAQSVLKAAPAQVGDAQGSRRRPRLRQIARRRGFQSIIAVPMMSKGTAIGTVSVTRREAGGFTDHEVELLTTFADQAVIAIENVRLFNETREALERQTATAEILRVISSSPTDVQPVFDMIGKLAGKLCAADISAVARFDGEKIQLVALQGVAEDGVEGIRRAFPMFPGEETVIARAFDKCDVEHVADVMDNPSYARKSAARAGGYRGCLGVPMIREGNVIGVIFVARVVPGYFADSQVALLKTFADQAVIAIENVRLFNETRDALERQTATADILKVISGSPTDIKPVLDAVAENAARLCEASDAIIQLREGGQLRWAAHYGALPNLPLDDTRTISPELVTGRAVLERRQIHVHDLQAETDDYPIGSQLAAEFGYHTILATPLMREGNAVGVIMVRHNDVRPFNDKHLALVSTFADQAVIAIENVRLFNETREALERQTASAEILRVIASSPSQVEPVFEAIVASAKRLFNAKSAVLLRRGETHFSVGAYAGPEIADLAEEVREAPLDRAKNFPSRAILGAEIVHIPDWSVDDIPEHERIVGKAFGIRSGLMVPLLRNNAGIGAIAVTRESAGAYGEKEIALLRSFADQAVIAIENVRLFNETKEALERQTATAEILKVISSSPTDVQPVFDTIVKNAVELSDALFSAVYRFEGERLHLVAHHNFTPEVLEMENRVYPMRPDRGQAVGRAILERELVHIPDALVDPDYQHDIATTGGWRSMVAVPMFREGAPVGVIWVARAQAGPFSDHQIELLKTFADQAVIAIENVRLFNETKEALERQTATAEILRVISGSPTDVQPVFDAIVRSAVQLCDAVFGVAVKVEGNLVHLVTQEQWPEESLARAQQLFPMPLDSDHLSAIAIRENRVIHVDRLQDDPALPATSRELARLGGYQALLIVPMTRGAEAIGAIDVARKQAFSDDQIALLKTFADQAVIAIENVRLFNETKEALERQTATAEILQVISGSPADVQPVFETIVRRAVQLCDSLFANLFRYDGEQLHFVASHNVSPQQLDIMKDKYPMRADDSQISGRVILGKAIVRMENALDDPAYDRRFAEAGGWRRMLGVPMMREGKILGAMVVGWAQAGPIAPNHEMLLKTFVDQAAIAIENVRLFNETKEALERQTATADILKVIAGSPSDVQPVFDAIAQSARRLIGGRAAVVARRVDGELHLAAMTATSASADEALRKAFPTPLTGQAALGKAILSGQPAYTADVETDPAFSDAYRETMRARGTRSFLAVPMLRESNAVGGIAVTRDFAGPFTDHQINLLQTFADQAVIAIENVRLFNETKEALERQTATAEILKVISESPTDVQPVFDAIVRVAGNLVAPCSVIISMVDGQQLHLNARHAGSSTTAETLAGTGAAYPVPFDPARAPSARAILERRVIEIQDADAPETPEFTRRAARAGGFRSAAFIPLIREDKGIGTIIVTHPQAGFKLSEKQLEVMRTFASQAVIAIENVRLFKELQQRTEALTKSVGQLTALGEVSQALSSTLDLEKVLQTIVSRAVHLTGLDGGALYEYDEDRQAFNLRGAENIPEELVDLYRREPIRLGEGAVGMTAASREPVQIANITEEGYQSRARDFLIRSGSRALLAVPLLREGHILGALAVTRNSSGEFAPGIVELLRTFATQSAIAIQNARLFREIEQKGRQLQEASQHKSQFLASMSHELRTPLNAILGFNEMLLGEVYGEVPTDMKEPLEDIQTSGKHLLRLINNVLDLAKIEAGRMELALADYSVQDMVESVRTTLRPLAEAKGLEFLASVPNDLPLAHGDSGRLTQCLMNLAGNSLKFTKEGHVAISVEPNGDTLAFRVADTGIGIPPEKIDTLFTEFKQTDATIASEYGGTGLGLSISKKFIEMHGGRIWVESELGKGSSFIFEIPLRVEAGAAA